MRLAAIDYHLRTSDPRLCPQARGQGILALELTRGTMLAERRWLSQPEGVSKWYHAALAMGIAIESLSATFAYEWPPIDSRGRADATSLDAIADLAIAASQLGAPLVHVPCLEMALPKNPADLRRCVQQLSPMLEIARQQKVVVALETGWPADLAKSLTELDPETLAVSLDVGNCLAVGRDPAVELATLDETVGQVRLRDRRRHEMFRSLPLGHGDVNWSAVQQQLTKLSRRPRFVLASTGGASLVESHASAGRLLYQLLSEPLVSRVA